MTTIWTYVLLVVGFVLLIKGADFFVEGSSGIAKKLKVPSLIIGLTIVAMGTSLPECAVSVAASISGNNALAVSNVVGSNIFNLMVVCGFCAVITPLAVGKRTLKQEFPFSVLMAALLLVLGYIGMSVGRIDGVILLIFFALFMFWMVRSALKARTAGITTDASEEADEIERAKPIPVWLCLVYIVGGAAAIAFGGDLTVDAASRIAIDFGMSQNLVGLTIVSIGTSLPELVTSIVAARKNEVDMAVGNAIGSNIFNILMVLGIASAISPLQLIGENIIDIVVLVVFSIVVWFFGATKKEISRTEGIIMICLYLCYSAYIIMR